MEMDRAASQFDQLENIVSQNVPKKTRTEETLAKAKSNNPQEPAAEKNQDESWKCFGTSEVFNDFFINDDIFS